MRTPLILVAALTPALAFAQPVSDGASCEPASSLALFGDSLADAAAAVPPPMSRIVFERAGWAERIEDVYGGPGHLYAGAPVELSIDPNRFPGCVGTITGFVRDGAGSVTEVPMSGPVNGRYTGTAKLPASGAIDVWFRSERPAVENLPGCTLWDSNLGNDYTFETRPYQPVRATFAADGSQPSFDGTLRRGGSLIIDYDPDRLTGCRSSYLGNPTWSIIAHVRYDDGRVSSKNVAGTIPYHGGPVAFAIPDDARAADVWFENVGYYPGNANPCRAWDSRYGSNYRIEIAD